MAKFRMTGLDWFRMFCGLILILGLVFAFLGAFNLCANKHYSDMSLIAGMGISGIAIVAMTITGRFKH